jgi:hypothetical protein
MAVATAATDFRMLAAVEMAEKVDEDLRSLKQRTCVRPATHPLASLRRCPSPSPPPQPLDSPPYSPQLALMLGAAIGRASCTMGGYALRNSLLSCDGSRTRASCICTSSQPLSIPQQVLPSQAAPMLCPTERRAPL